ncbi:transposase InsO family protein [Streptosporangium lutulentum]|uniref:Transposase InsO family protein n=2 Tax=Streptosporangium lutulentum TaxID=1461250 RepID=A0ABT9QB03_9ACTN|nr:IS3 family transposase [Streptosporangium lutulentum]MDP9842333.1 transposase InsO family protein [Streptosporangium lutulentum]MDP9843942.1 transposase InsO family protein [Streptosporangium lutulentum]MDP9847629.1 transposase InsO family protein [Streptosporangium lutulentum]
MAAFISSQKTEHDVPHAVTCRALGVSQSWYYKWRDRAPTARQQRRKDLDAEIAAKFTASGGTYGSPRITRDLHEQGWRISENTVAQRMAELGLAGRAPRRRRSLTRQGKRPAAPDLVRRSFTAVAPDVLWCGDVTEIVTDEGKLYLATVEDLFSRRLLGYAMSEHHDAALTIASLQMAAVTRGGNVDGVIFHTDRGSEYTAARFQAACRHWGVVQSMGRVGCALDNAAAESFNSTLKVEYVHRHRFRARAEARLKIATWIADFYNARRRHSAADGLPPIVYEQQIMTARIAARARLQEASAA